MVKRTGFRALFVATLVAGFALSWTLLARADNRGHGLTVHGAGTSIVRGGTGAPPIKPVITKFGFSFGGSESGFECLALVPSAAAGDPGSGNFDTNAMYVTGTISSVQIDGDTAVLKGSATVTGVGAGTDQPFIATVTRGGPGATLVLAVSGLTFREIVLEGQIVF
jgi:hypothetical protein